MTEPVMEPEMTADEPTTDETAEPAAAVAEATPPTTEAPEATTEAAPEATTAEAPEAAPEAQPIAAAAAEEPAPAAKPAKGARASKAAPAPVADTEPAMAEAEPVKPPTSKPTGNTAAPRGLRVKYSSEVVPALVKQFEYANPNQVPKLEKIVVNVGLGEALSNAKAIDAASGDLIMITGQKPIVMKARRSIAQFRVRTGNPIGLKVTLRGQRMWDFLERLTLLTLPRIRDFRGIPSKSFDGRGNYTLGMREQIAFPEIDYDKVDRLRGLEVSIVTTAKSDEESKRLLELLGMPFAG
jgi:large subunit ribosomal protein L5